MRGRFAGPICIPWATINGLRLYPLPAGFILTLIVFVISLNTGVCSSRGEESILSFYNKAESRAQNPPDEAYLEVICREKIDDLYVTFVGIETDTVLLAAITDKKLKHPEREMLLKVGFYKIPEPPFIRPSAGSIWAWGYVYDRNGDGKIDYIVFSNGYAPIKQKDFPLSYPKRNEGLDLNDLGIAIKSLRFFFTHMADDNYDGKVDAVVFESIDSERDWIEGWMAVRSTKFDGVPDEAWFFNEDINLKEKNAERVGNGFRSRSLFNFGSVFGQADLDKMNNAMVKFNQAAEKCKLTGSSFYRP